jgi:hypothetical protein
LHSFISAGLTCGQGRAHPLFINHYRAICTIEFRVRLAAASQVFPCFSTSSVSSFPCSHIPPSNTTSASGSGWRPRTASRSFILHIVSPRALVAMSADGLPIRLPPTVDARGRVRHPIRAQILHRIGPAARAPSPFSR